MKNPFRRPLRVDPKDLDRQTKEVEDKLEKEGPRMRYIAAWLEWRGKENGFGADFEFTIRPRGAS